MSVRVSGTNLFEIDLSHHFAKCEIVLENGFLVEMGIFGVVVFVHVVPMVDQQMNGVILFPLGPILREQIVGDARGRSECLHHSMDEMRRFLQHGRGGQFASVVIPSIGSIVVKRFQTLLEESRIAMSDEHLVAHEHSLVPLDRHLELAEFVQTLDQIDVVVEIDSSVFGENPIAFDVRGVKQPVGRTQRSAEGVRRHGSMFDLDDSVGVRPLRLQLRPILPSECFDVGVNVDRVGSLSEMRGSNDANVDEGEILFLEPNEMNQIRHDEIRHAGLVVKPIEAGSRPCWRRDRDEPKNRHEEEDEENGRNDVDDHDLDENSFLFDVQLVEIRYSRLKETSHLL